MRDTGHDYQTKHARQCSSTLSDSQVSAWLARELVACESLQKSIRKVFRYSALQIVHLVVLSQLSLWGILLRAAYTSVCGLDGRWFSLKEAHKLVGCYCEAGPDLVLTVILTETPVKIKDQRLRTSATMPRIIVMKPPELEKFVKKYRSRDNISGGTRDFALSTYDLDDTAPADLLKDFGFLIIDVKRIIQHVYETLEITRFLK